MLLFILPILVIPIYDYFVKHSFFFQYILIPIHLKCQLSYNKKSFYISFISNNIILILNLTISNIFIQILILILTHSKWSTHFTHFIGNCQNGLNGHYQIGPKFIYWILHLFSIGFKGGKNKDGEEFFTCCMKIFIF